MRRRTLVVIAIAAGGFGASLVVRTPVLADDGPGSGLLSASLAADAGGQRILADTFAGQSPGTADTGVPYASSSLTLSTAHALSSVAWPSNLVGNAGSLLALLGPYPCTPGDVGPVPLLPPRCSPVAIPQPVQDQYHYLNSPVRAEAQYPASPSADTSVPGATMTARTTASTATADALVGAAVASDIESFGSVHATSSVVLTGARTAVARSRSTMSDITLGGGLITIGSVASSAYGETDGVRASSSGATTVHNMRVAGVAVYVDRRGVHAGSAVAPVDAATAAVNSALSGAGFTIYMTRPTRTTHNGATSYDAASVIVEWGQGMTFVFGGAHVTAGASLPYVVHLPPPAVPGSAPAPPAGSVPLGGLGGPASSGGTAQGPPAQLAQPPAAPAAAEFRVVSGVRVGWVLIGLAAAVAAAALLRRLPDHALDDPRHRCPREE